MPHLWRAAHIVCPDAPLRGPDDLCQDDALQNGAVSQEFLDLRIIRSLINYLVPAEQPVHCDAQIFGQPDQWAFWFLAPDG